MDEPVVAVLLAPGAAPPEYQTEGSAGADLRAFVGAPIVIGRGERAVVPTGLRLQLPPGYEAQVRSRSGLAAKHGVACLNSPGTIDSDYRGEVLVILQNSGSLPFTVSSGDRIAQLVVAPVSKATFVRAGELESSARGDGGLGSTGS